MAGSKLSRIYVLMGAITLLLVIALFLIPEPPIPESGPQDSPTYGEEPMPPGDGESLSERGEGEGKTSKEEKQRVKYKLVIVIDDVGYNLTELKSLLQFPGPITFAILPGLDYSEAALAMIQKAGKDAILHLPMEPEGGDDPGLGAIFTDMDDEAIKTTLGKHLDSLKGISGANNHMGSRATADPRVMKVVLTELKKRKMFFLDSRTSPKTVVGETANTIELPFGERSIFLDNTQEREAIMDAFREGMAKAEKSGHAVMIGHVWSHALAEVLLEVYPQALEEGFEFLSVSDLIYKEE